MYSSDYSCKVTFRLPKRQNFVMTIADRLRGSAYIQLTAHDGEVYKRLMPKDDLGGKIEIIGDPDKDLVVEAVAVNGRTFYAPEIWVSSAYPWSSAMPEITRGYSTLRPPSA